MKTKTCGRFVNWSVLGLLLALVVMVSPKYAFGQPPANCGTQDFYAVHFLGVYEGVIVGANKTLCMTHDAGKSWERATTLPPLPPASAFYDAQFVNITRGWVVGSGGTILKTSDGGTTWVAQKSNTTYTLRAVYFVNANTGWAVGDAATIRKTTDGGTTWVAQSAGNFDGASDIYCMNSTMCRIVGSSSGGSSPIKLTNDGGTTWWVATVVSPTTLLGVHFGLNPIAGFAVGIGGAIRRASASGSGLTWTSESSGTTATLFDVHCVNGSQCWVVGSGGTIRKGPGTWVAQTSGTTAILYDVHFINADRGWAVGSGGTIRKTINGGATWTP